MRSRVTASAERDQLDGWSPVVDSRAAAVALGCSVRHVQNLVSRGDLTNRGTPRRILVDLDEIEEHLAEQLRKG